MWRILSAPLRSGSGSRSTAGYRTTVLSGQHEKDLPPHPEHLPSIRVVHIILMVVSGAIMRGIEARSIERARRVRGVSGMALVFAFLVVYSTARTRRRNDICATRKNFGGFACGVTRHFPLYLGSPHGNWC